MSDTTLSAQLVTCMSILRTAHDITDYQIAIRTGLCKSTVRRIMKGEMSVSLSTVDKMMRAFPEWALELSVKEIDQ